MSTKAASPYVLAARSAVRQSLADLIAGDVVIVACSGGPDSLALVGATAWVARRAGLTTVAVVIDHGLQPGSAQVSAWAAARCGDLGVDLARRLLVHPTWRRHWREEVPEGGGRATVACATGVPEENENGLKQWTQWTPPTSHLLETSAQGRNRTSDTGIFNPLLYQLSYLGRLT